jgi:hypothetical protein
VVVFELVDEHFHGGSLVNAFDEHGPDPEPVGVVDESRGPDIVRPGQLVQSGVLLYDMADPAQPRFTRSIRTNGYAADVIVDEGATTAYLPTGYYGVERVALQNP